MALIKCLTSWLASFLVRFDPYTLLIQSSHHQFLRTFGYCVQLRHRKTVVGAQQRIIQDRKSSSNIQVVLNWWQNRTYLILEDFPVRTMHVVIGHDSGISLPAGGSHSAEVRRVKRR